MNTLLSFLFVAVLILDLFALGNGRILSIIRIVAVQGVLLGILPLLIHEHLTALVLIPALATISLKGIIIPAMMIKAMRDIKIKREMEPLLGLLPSTILGALAMGITFLSFADTDPSITGSMSLLIPTSFSTIIVGFILLTSRYKALSQVLGYLILENGIYIFSLLLVDAIPLVVEMGMLLDLFVSIFIISIITNHINKAFSSLDTRRLTELKE